MKKKYLLILPLILLLFTSAESNEKAKRRNALDQLGMNFSKKNGLKFLNSGYGSLADASYSFWALNFTSTQTLTLEQARPLVLKLIDTIKQTVYNNNIFLDFCKQRSSLFKSPDPLKDIVGFKIAFWDYNVNRPLHPYLAQIRCVDGKVFYHYADSETQALMDPIVETLEDLKLPNNKH